jgi:molybdate transport system substrate-binding protein
MKVGGRGGGSGPRWGGRSGPLAMRLFVAVALSISGGCARAEPQPARPLLVFAAASLQPALDALLPVFQASTGTSVDLVLGSSGQLAAQIRSGAPADLFLSSDAVFLDALVDAGLLDRNTRRPYALGRIVLIAPVGKSPPPSLSALSDPAFALVAIANPEVAPYGRAAEEALRRAGVWEAIQPRLVLAGSVAQTLQILRSGNADAAIVARGALPLGDSALAPFTPIDPELHAPLLHTAAVVAGSPRAAEALAFLEFLTTGAGRDILVEFGFDLPEIG